MNNHSKANLLNVQVVNTQQDGRVLYSWQQGDVGQLSKGAMDFHGLTPSNQGPFSLFPALQTTATSALPQYLAFCFCSRVGHLLSIIHREFTTQLPLH